MGTLRSPKAKCSAEWMDVAVAVNESFNIKVARLGDNMLRMGETEGENFNLGGLLTTSVLETLYSTQMLLKTK